MIKMRYRRRVILLLTVLITFGLTSCQRSRNSPASGDGPATAQLTPEQKVQTEFERDLQFIRNGQFKYVFVFSRKDGKPLDRDDGDYLRKNAPQVVDWAKTDGLKKVIAGTNFDLEQGNLELLKKRFVVEDYTGK